MSDFLLKIFLAIFSTTLLVMYIYFRHCESKERSANRMLLLVLVCLLCISADGATGDALGIARPINGVMDDILPDLHHIASDRDREQEGRGYTADKAGSQSAGYGTSGMDTSATIDMSSMFSNCQNLQYLDLSDFDTSATIDMSSMFSNCHDIQDLDLSGGDMSGDTDLR